MKKTPLKRKTPLVAKTPLKSKSCLERRTPLRAKALSKEHNSVVKRKKYVPMYKYESIFTSDLKRCVITGSCERIEIHHIFGGANKHLAEKYHFLLPLRADWHKVSNYSIHMDRQLNLKYKLACQDYWIRVLKKTKEEWLEEFSHWWTEEDGLLEL